VALGTGNEAAKVKFIDGDITKEDTLQPACNGMDAVVCTVGAAAGWRIPGYNQSTPKHVDFLGVKNLSEAAASAMVYILFYSLLWFCNYYPLGCFVHFVPLILKK